MFHSYWVNRGKGTEEVFIDTHSLILNGTTEYIEILADSSFGLGSSGLLSGWFKFNSVPGSGSYRELIASFNPSSPYPGFTFQIVGIGSSQARLSLYRGNGITNQTVGDTGTALSLNTWYHLAVTWNGGTIDFYVNGALSSSKSVTNISVGDSSTVLRIGLDTNTVPSRYLSAYVNQVFIAQKYVNLTELGELRDGTSAKADLRDISYWANRVAWWRIGEPSESLEDASGNGHDGSSNSNNFTEDVA